MPPGSGTQKNVIAVRDGKFIPPALEVSLGDTVVWDFEESGHSTVADNGEWDSGPMMAGTMFAYTFPEKFSGAGERSYHCREHPEMRGAVTVFGI